MEKYLGFLRVRVRRGINLVVRDTSTSDPYVVVSMADQEKKTIPVKDNCNPQWNDEVTLSVEDITTPIKLTVHDKDTLTVDDTMGEADIDIKPYIECFRMEHQYVPDGTKIRTVEPNDENCLVCESAIVWNKEKLIQDMLLKLKNVKSGQVDIQIEWIDVPGRKGLEQCSKNREYSVRVFGIGSKLI